MINFGQTSGAGAVFSGGTSQFIERAALLGEGASVVGPAEVAAAYAPASGGGKPKPEGGGGTHFPNLNITIQVWQVREAQ